MENWWFFRDTKDAKIYEQRKIAEQLVPDRRHWLGGEPQAIPGFRFSRDLTELIYSDTEEQLHKPSADRPIKKGISCMYPICTCLLVKFQQYRALSVRATPVG